MSESGFQDLKFFRDVCNAFSDGLKADNSRNFSWLKHVSRDFSVSVKNVISWEKGSSVNKERLKLH